MIIFNMVDRIPDLAACIQKQLSGSKQLCCLLWLSLRPDDPSHTRETLPDITHAIQPTGNVYTFY
jgi:hypothetical protein